MKEIRKKVTQEVKTGWEFSVRLSDGYEYKIETDLSGVVILADYGSDRGWCTVEPKDNGFEDAVEIAMEGILKNDKDEFVRMRAHLSPFYKAMAENIRKNQTKNYDF